MTFVPPNEQEVAGIFKKALNKSIISVKRFPTGMAHYVYDVKTPSGNFALRVANPEMKTGYEGVYAFRAALKWYNTLKPMGIILPEIYYEDIEAKNSPFHCYIMERLNGVDLMYVYDDMTTAEKEKLAKQIADMQNKVATLPFDNGFGWSL